CRVAALADLLQVAQNNVVDLELPGSKKLLVRPRGLSGSHVVAPIFSRPLIPVLAHLLYDLRIDRFSFHQHKVDLNRKCNSQSKQDDLARSPGQAFDDPLRTAYPQLTQGVKYLEAVETKMAKRRSRIRD